MQLSIKYGEISAGGNDPGAQGCVVVPSLILIK